MLRTVVIIFAILVLGVGAYFAGKYGVSISVNNKNTAAPIATQGEAPTSPATPAAAPIPSPSDNSVLISAVKEGLVSEHGPDASSMNVTVSTVEGSYAKGMASSTGGGAIWFAANTSGTWELVWDGNGTITCATLANYPNFPSTLIPECWNEATNKLISR